MHIPKLPGLDVQLQAAGGQYYGLTHIPTPSATPFCQSREMTGPLAPQDAATGSSGRACDSTPRVPRKAVTKI